MCKYTLEYNPTTKTWCVFKNIIKEHSFNFYVIYEIQDIKKQKKNIGRFQNEWNYYNSYNMCYFNCNKYDIKKG